MVRTPGRRQVLVVQRNHSTDTGAPHSPLPLMERRTAGALERGREGNGLENEQMPEYPDL